MRMMQSQESAASRRAVQRVRKGRLVGQSYREAHQEWGHMAWKMGEEEHWHLENKEAQRKETQAQRQERKRWYSTLVVVVNIWREARKMWSGCA